jgi:lysine/ornithine N-monooxygenase
MRKDTTKIIAFILLFVTWITFAKFQQDKINNNINIIKALWYENKILKESLQEQTLPEIEYKIMNYFNYKNEADLKQEYNNYLKWKLQ